MDNIFKGIVIGALGLIIVFQAGLVFGIMAGLTGVADPTVGQVLFVGLCLMIGGPVVYIVVIPIVDWIRRRLKRSREAKD